MKLNRVISWGSCLLLVVVFEILLYNTQLSSQSSGNKSKELRSIHTYTQLQLPNTHKQVNQSLQLQETFTTLTMTTVDQLPNTREIKQSLLVPQSFTPLTTKEADQVEKFVFFVGYPRSGHSIIGTMMDAHPNMIIAHEYELFDTITEEGNNLKKLRLFNDLYQNSFKELVDGYRGLKGLKNKGYLLAINSTWQASFTQLRVIGNKGGGRVTARFMKNSSMIINAYHALEALVDMPVLVIHVVRNPLDMIATQTLYRAGTHPGGPDHKYPANETMKYKNDAMVIKVFRKVFGRADAVVQLTKTLNWNVLDLHHEDMIEDPRSTLQKLCDFLGVDCSDSYLQSCIEKSYHSTTKPRNVIAWNEQFLNGVRNNMKRYTFFKRYYDDFR